MSWKDLCSIPNKNGTYVHLEDNGHKCVSNYRNNLLEGEAKRFFIEDDSKVQMISNWSKDFLNGVYKEFNIDGKVCLSATYINGSVDKFILYDNTSKEVYNNQLIRQYRNTSQN